MSPNSQETLVPEETPVKFPKFLRAAILENNSGWLPLKCGHCKNEAREIDFLCCRKVDVMFIASAIIPGYEGSILPSSF